MILKKIFQHLSNNMIAFMLMLLLMGCNAKGNRSQSPETLNNHPDTLLTHAKNILFTYPDSALLLALKAEALAKEQQNLLALGGAYKMQASYYSDIKTDYEQATLYCHRADSIYRSHKGRDFLLGSGTVYHNLGTLELRQGNYLPAVEHFTQAMHLLDSLQDKKTLPRTLNNLSTLYSFLKDNARSEQYARECYQMAKENKDDYLVSVSSTTLAAALIGQGKYGEVPELLDNALQIAQTRKDNYILELVHLNYGGYYQFFRKEYNKALEHLLQASLYADSLQNEFEKMRVSSNLSELYFALNQPQKSEMEIHKAIELARKFHSMDVEQRALNILAKIEARRKNFSKAYQLQELSFRLRDTVLNESNKQHLNYLEANFQNEKKELKIAYLETQKKHYGIITLTSALILLLLFFVFYLRHKAMLRQKKLAEHQVIQLEKEKQLVATQAVLEGETAERTRLARDLHDGLGGMLSAVKLNLFDIKQGVVVEPEDVARFSKVMEMLDSAMQELRRVAHNMMPVALSRYGLKVALEDFCGNFPNVVFHFFGQEKRLGQKLENTLYRSVFELVNNAVKHADADTINVQIVQQPDRISINVQDNGKGFDTEKNHTGIGLRNIKNRIQAVGGEIHLLSTIGNGTEITIDIELNQDENGKD